MHKVFPISFNKKIYKSINDFLSFLYEYYSSLDHSLKIDDNKLNLSKEKIKEFELTKNTEFYLKAFKAISSYRDALKINTEKFISDNIKNGLYFYNFEFRTKNINSIFSKIYRYIYEKDEKGEIPINKCLNDLFGLRVILPFQSFTKTFKILCEICKKNNNLKIIDSSKNKYKAIHIYLKKDNYSMQWEIQFWLKKDDKSNRISHKQYKQAYTLWEGMINRGSIVSVEKN